MLLQQIDSTKYIAEFKDRFSNFCQKAPILMSFVTTAVDVQVTHENSGTVYTFQWDFSVSVKSFIHDIKTVISDAHYPRIALVTRENVPYTPEEIAKILEENAAHGVLGTDVPATHVVEKREVYRVDRVIALKDTFLIQSETTKNMFLYKMNYSSVMFLRSYRTGKFGSIEEAGAFFFSKSELVHELTSSNG